MEVLSEIGRRIKAARIAVPMTQKEMAAAANLSQRTISNIENGTDVSVSTLLEVLRVLGQLQSLDMAIPEDVIRPSQWMALGKPRERVRKSTKTKAPSQSGWKWGDEE